MKLATLIAAAFVVALGTGITAQQTTPTTGSHRIVIELTSGEPMQWESVLNNVENVRRALGADATRVAVVAHGEGLGLVMKTNTALQQRVERLAADGVVFAACENTMRRKKVTRADLLPAATTVDSGVAEVVRRQEAGWAYLKGGS